MTIYDLKFICPDVRSQEDAVIVRESLFNTPGIEDVTVDLRDHSVEVRTANQDGGAEVLRALSAAGYPPEEEE